MNGGANSEARWPVERRAPRERVFLQARISFANGAASLPCLVTEISQTGAKFALGDQVSLPERFRVFVGQRGVDQSARLIWRRHGHAAVAFVEMMQDDDKDLARGLAALHFLQAENARLRATVAELTGELRRIVPVQPGPHLLNSTDCLGNPSAKR